MLTIAALSGPLPRAGVVVAALLATGAMLLRRSDLRAWSMAGALVLAPVLLIADVWHSSQFEFMHRHPAEGIAGAVVVLIAVAAAAWVLRRWPVAFPLLVMVALPFRLPISTGGGTAKLLVPLYFVIAAGALAWIAPTLWAYRGAADPTARPKDRDPSYLFERLLAAFVVVYAIQALYSSNFTKALENEVFFYVPFAVLYSLLRSVEWDRGLLARCVGVTVVLAVLFACFGFVEEATKTLLWNPKLIATNQEHRYFSVNSVFYDPDIFGRYLAMVMVLVTTVLLYSRRRMLALGSCVVLAVLWAGLIFTLSRSSLAALMVGLAVLAAFRWKTWPVVSLAAVVAVVGLIAVIVSPTTFGINQGLNRASSGRANLISGGIHFFASRPVTGYGSGSFSTEYKLKYPRQARTVSDSHTIPVTVAAEQGLIGLAFYLAFVGTALITLFGSARGNAARVGIAATFLALLLHTMLYADFLEDPMTWTLLGIGAALAVADRARDRSSPRRPRRAQVEV